MVGQALTLTQMMGKINELVAAKNWQGVSQMENVLFECSLILRRKGDRQTRAMADHARDVFTDLDSGLML